MHETSAKSCVIVLATVTENPVNKVGWGVGVMAGLSNSYMLRGKFYNFTVWPWATSSEVRKRGLSAFDIENV